MNRLVDALALILRPALMGSVLVGLASGGKAAPVPAELAPARNVLVFTMSVSGSGNDPNPAANIANPVQHWTYERAIDGWFEVDVTRRKEGTGDTAQEFVVFTRKLGGRHQMIGMVSDLAQNKERWIGKGSATDNYADYSARETADWSGAVEPPESFALTLNATKQTWVELFDPQSWMGDYRPKMDFRGEARFEPASRGEFGEPWLFEADDPTLRSAGARKRIDARYYPGDRSYVSLLPAWVKHDVPAKGDAAAPSGRIEFDVPRPDGAVGTWKKMHYVLDWSVRTE